MNKIFLSLLAVSSAAAFTALPVTAQAQSSRGRSAGRPEVPAFNRPAAPPALAGAVRPAPLNVNRPGSLRGGRFNGSNFAGYRHHYRGGRRYYYGGGYYPYDPFFYGFGFGYPYYYGGGVGLGYTGSLGYGDYEDAPANYVYEGRVVNETAPGRYQPGSLASAVQSALKKRGYYKGKIDGQFGAGSSRALREFQRDKDLPVTGRIDERTLEALGFERR